MKEIIVNNKIFKQFRNTNYYASEDGQIYSLYSDIILDPYITNSGHKRVDIYHDGKCRHEFVHRIVYECWVGKIPEGLQINHKNDNKDDNHYSNLYCGNQKENIYDCIRNGNRVGNFKLLMVEDKNTGDILEFLPASEFFDYCNHNNLNGSVSRVFKRKWFIDNYNLIYYGKGVTTRESDGSISQQ